MRYAVSSLSSVVVKPLFDEVTDGIRIAAPPVSATVAISLPYRTAQMLLIVSWFAEFGGLFTAVAIALDVLQHPQHTKIMNIVWPITGLYLPIVGWWLYDNMSRPKPIYGRVITGRQRFLTIVFVSATHCASGCVVGDLIGAPIVFAADWNILGERLYAEYVVLFALAYCLGIAFQYFPIRTARKITPRSALVEAVKADSFALTACEAGLFAWMGVVYFLVMPRPELTSPFYWFMMQIGMVIGFITSLPPNWLLVRSGVKLAM
jgi:hypothetical protein